MKKDEIVEMITSNSEETFAYVTKVYGVSHGVGYDLNVIVNFKEFNAIELEVHALAKSWACVGHLRPYQNEFKVYTGSCDYYQTDVVQYWEQGNGLKEYLGRLKKDELIAFAERVGLENEIV